MQKAAENSFVLIRTDTNLYRTPKMNAFDQLWCLKAVQPILDGLTSAAKARKAGDNGADPLFVASAICPTRR